MKVTLYPNHPTVWTHTIKDPTPNTTNNLPLSTECPSTTNQVFYNFSRIEHPNPFSPKPPDQKNLKSLFLYNSKNQKSTKNPINTSTTNSSGLFLRFCSKSQGFRTRVYFWNIKLSILSTWKVWNNWKW